MEDTHDLASPLFSKHADLDGIATGDTSYNISASINEILPGEAFGCQRTGGLWSIYLKSDLARLSLLRQGYFTLNNKRIQVHNENPMNTRVQTERVILKNLPIPESNDLIHEFIMTMPHIEPVGPISWSMSRNEANQLSEFANGDRFLDVKADFYPPLPKEVKIGDHACRIWHISQSAICLRCRDPQHQTGDTARCPAYLSQEKQKFLYPFKNPKNALTNFWEVKISMDGMFFRSTEHAYLWYMCTELDEPKLADRVMRAPTAAIAKQVSRDIPSTKNKTKWNNKKIDVMKCVLEAKANQSTEFVNFLLNTGDKYLVEATRDTFWGAGLSPHLCRTTDPASYPGYNYLGLLLMDLRMAINKKTSNVG